MGSTSGRGSLLPVPTTKALVRLIGAIRGANARDYNSAKGYNFEVPRYSVQGFRAVNISKKTSITLCVVAYTLDITLYRRHENEG